ncbi:MAG: magnesium transporter [Acidiferrobacterales bacterium]|jgi:magnesium transporter|nr:magnesium transporter [Acidiferrobacterales bacterium]
MTNSTFSLQEQHEALKRLIEKFELEMHLVDVNPGPRQELERSLLQKRHDAELERHLRRFHAADLADLIEVLSSEHRKLVWDHIPTQRRGEVMLELADAVLESVVESMSKEDIVAALSELDPDDLTYLSDAVPDEAFHTALQTLTSEERTWVHTAVTYREEEAGHLMASDMVILKPDQTMENVQAMLRSRKELPDHTDKLFVIDLRGHLIGALFLQDILLNESDTRVEDAMRERVVTFHPRDELDEVALAFERYDLVSAPVINERGKLIGRLTIDAVLDYVREESEKDALNVVGVVESEDLFARIWDSARNRWLWLGINLVTAFGISRVIGAFENTIAELIALASLMPIIASVAGNTGNQTTALVIRSLALNQLQGSNFWHLLRKELAISLLNGIVWGVVVGLFAYLFYQQIGLSVVVTVAMALSFLLAALLGVSAPVLLERIGRDPAMGSSVILTGMIDALGFFVFLLLASLFLV